MREAKRQQIAIGRSIALLNLRQCSEMCCSQALDTRHGTIENMKTEINLPAYRLDHSIKLSKSPPVNCKSLISGPSGISEQLISGGVFETSKLIELSPMQHQYSSQEEWHC